MVKYVADMLEEFPAQPKKTNQVSSPVGDEKNKPSGIRTIRDIRHTIAVLCTHVKAPNEAKWEHQFETTEVSTSHEEGRAYNVCQQLEAVSSVQLTVHPQFIQSRPSNVREAEQI
jgi:hypothetical protein